MIVQTSPLSGYLAHREEINSTIQKVLSKGRYVLGENVKAFEDAFSTYIGVRYAVGTASGTDAIHLALRACGIGNGDIVFTVSHTAVATVAAIEMTGAIPVFVDVNPINYTMDPQSLEEAIQQCTREKHGIGKAIIPVHLYGYPANMPILQKIAEKYQLVLIEDCAQAAGAEIDKKKVGSWGQMSAFSFYPTKNLGAIGDGGILLTNDSMLYQKSSALAQYGWINRISQFPGINSRLDELQSAILLVKLKYLNNENEKRRNIAASYMRKLSGSELILHHVDSGNEHVFHQFVIRSKRRDELREILLKKDIQTLIHYPIPVHLQPAYKDRVRMITPLKHTETIVNEILSLPMYPELNDSEIDLICNTIINCLEG